jgi:Uma2 family endonuclease
MAVQPTRYRFTRADYYRMAEAGILGEGDRVELIEGEIYRMSPIGPMHAGGVDRLNRLFSRTFGDAVIVRVQNPVVLDDYSEPEPDLTLLRPRADFYTGEHPNPEDILLAVEVADSSADWDRRVKAPLYVRSGIPELWCW